MRRIFGVMLMVLVLTTSEARAGESEGPTLGAPIATGDQLIYYYDTRANFTTFITLRNNGFSEMTVSFLYYGPTFSTPFSRAVTLTAGEVKVIDVGSLRGDGLPAQAGIAIATAVSISGQPIVTRALTGNFTVANLLTGSAFGASAAGRSAFQSNGEPPTFETVIDGVNVRLQFIRPLSATLSAYYDPTTLAPVGNGGNQLIFINFEDEYAPTYRAAIGSTTWFLAATRQNGSLIADTTFTANGVTVTDLASVAGTGVNGSAGSMLFTAADSPNLNRLIYFTESLGTFGTGYLLPEQSARPAAVCTVPAATSSAAPE